MIETYAMDDDGNLVIYTEAETPEEMALLAVQAQAAHAAGLADDEELTVTGGTEEQPYAPVTVAASAAHTDLVATHLAEIRRQERARAAAIVRAWLAPPGSELDVDAAAWIRAHAWTPAMVAEGPITAAACACQYGPSGHCIQGRHRQCVRGAPLTGWEALVCDRTGIYPAGDQPAAVYLADRVCRWVCPCGCHTGSSPASGTVPRTRPPVAEQLDLLTLTH